MKRSLVILLLAATSAGAASTFTETWNVSTAIPDNNPTGLANTKNVVTDITEITSVTVQLTTSGGWNGDLYASLTHGSGYSVLLNRIGRSESNPDGSGSSSMTIDLSDLAVTDIHIAAPSSGVFSGAYQPDGRTSDPANTLDSDARSAMLSSFIGLDANGSWTLFLADVSSGDTATLQSWTLTVTGVPEPHATLLAMLASGLMLLRRRR